MGGQLVVQMTDIIEANTHAASVDPVVVGAILRHESAAIERWVLAGLADHGETIQAQLAGDTASIGPGQMQIRRARELEELGYVAPQPNDNARTQALLGKESSIAYVTGMVRYLGDQLRNISGFDRLPAESQQRILLIGYNQGWELLKDNIDILGFKRLMERSGYDDQTLDEYLRWRAGK